MQAWSNFKYFSPKNERQKKSGCRLQSRWRNEWTHKWQLRPTIWQRTLFPLGHTHIELFENPFSNFHCLCQLSLECHQLNSLYQNGSPFNILWSSQFKDFNGYFINPNTFLDFTWAETPKSASLTSAFSVRRIFAPLISRCILQETS